MPRHYGHDALSEDDQFLIWQCKQERRRINAEIARLRKLDPKANYAAIVRLRQQRDQLSDPLLAEKFEVPRWRIEKVMP